MRVESKSDSPLSPCCWAELVSFPSASEVISNVMSVWMPTRFLCLPKSVISTLSLDSVFILIFFQGPKGIGLVSSCALHLAAEVGADLITFRLLLSIARIDSHPDSVDLGSISPASRGLGSSSSSTASAQAATRALVIAPVTSGSHLSLSRLAG